MVNKLFKEVEVIFKDSDAAKKAGAQRLANDEDKGITTKEQAVAYRGPYFTEGQGISNLHLSVDGQLAIVSGNQTEGKDKGKLVRYMYPLAGIARIKTCE